MLNDDGSKVRENISIFISILSKLTIGKHFGLYGLVVWTKHDEYIDELKKALSQAALPIDDTDSDNPILRIFKVFNSFTDIVYIVYFI